MAISVEQAKQKSALMERLAKLVLEDSININVRWEFEGNDKVFIDHHYVPNNDPRTLRFDSSDEALEYLEEQWKFKVNWINQDIVEWHEIANQGLSDD